MLSKLSFFSRDDFKPHPQDASIPLIQRLEGHNIAGITLGQNSILIDQVKIIKGQVNILALENIDNALDETSAKAVTQTLHKANINKAIINMPYGSCPIRESIPQKLSDLDILTNIRQKPKTIIKDNYDSTLLYSVLTAKDSTQSLIFSARQTEIQHIENLLSDLKICRFTQGIYSGLFYLSRFSNLSEGITLLLDFNSVLCLKVEKAQWVACSYRSFEVYDEAFNAIEEMLSSLSPDRGQTIYWINNISDRDLINVLGTYKHRPLLENYHRPLLYTACFG